MFGYSCVQHILWCVFIWVCLGIVVSNTYCGVFLFCLSLSCVLCTQCCQFLWIFPFLIAPSVFSNVYLQWENWNDLFYRKISFSVGLHFPYLYISIEVTIWDIHSFLWYIHNKPQIVKLFFRAVYQYCQYWPDVTSIYHCQVLTKIILNLMNNITAMTIFGPRN